ncbi:Sua5/YciO/YrdC/YwlC family protein [Aphanomyces invadans]|uniref:Threonylcarbamoyl-AMP synthase n=1 Tax=Aphanomyces invadans TaxID=157072 RepID=A0A024UNY3_9STRA|nr:Sua5/YciO/YrdC/YwlC family protein [Aphanomyces invadans]ETW07999.1 Sua5/YciO/YrdC/YwlC family protein [Aphanomyces invadans]|eukprot:XP_008864092.1 Sua5/YciO/YrdC/YwlC family protein [Aphanomyces invadans]
MLLAATPQGLARAGESLRQGRLVAFPTETVYGLGANAFDAKALLSIFEAKGRPLTDPLIVHIPTVDDALALVELDDKGTAMFKTLATAFWPGPLTLIAPAIPALPREVSANTGFVGLRIPNHSIAQALLREAKVPVAAPSANRFGHVSPTTAQHVVNDLGTYSGGLEVIDNVGHPCCQVGIESTVAKLVPDQNQLLVFRRGGVSEAALHDVLNVQQRLHVDIVYAQRVVADHSTQNQVAPGQLLTHYAPDVPTFMVDTTPVAAPADADVRTWVVVDFHGQLQALQPVVAAYLDLSPPGDITEAARNVFDALRWAEQVPNATRILIPDVSAVAHEHAAALHDRLFRASSGNRTSI